MAIDEITKEQADNIGVVAAPDTLDGTAAQNKEVFDQLPQLLRLKLNEVIQELNRLSENDVFTVKAPDGSIVYMRLNSDKVLETSTDGVNFEATGSSGHVVLDAPLLYDADDVRAMMMVHGTDGGPYSTARVLVDICGRQGARGV